MKSIEANPSLVAACGLYCGACGAYRKGTCPGCRENAKATWCQVRSCCREFAYASCADCTQVKNAADCRKFDNFMAKLFSFLMGSDRGACIAKIRSQGYAEFARFMSEHRLQSIKR